MALLSQFDTPARVRDVPSGSTFYAAWSDWIAGGISALTPGDNGGGFYNPTMTNVTVAGEKMLTWMGFPRDTILPTNRDDITPALIAADANPTTRAAQNEYFEWRVERNAAGKIRKLTFVTELPEYYEQLWNVDPDAVVAIYRMLVNPAVTRVDLEGPGGTYDRRNRWNTVDGIVHDIQRINTLGAALGLAQSATTSPAPFRDNYEANPGLAMQPTSVDPRVSIDVHMLVRKGLYVTLRDPIGIYILAWDDSGITKSDGTPAGDYWRVVRGVPGMVMRLEYEVPPGQGFVVGDLKIGGRRIEYGGQLARQITVGIAGTAGLPGRGS